MNQPSLQPAPTDLTAVLADNVNQHLSCAQRLHGALAEEHQALLSKNVDALVRATATKAAAAERLQELGHGLEQIRRGTGQAQAAPDVESLFERIGTGPEVSHAWQTVLELAAECAEANDANAALLDARQTEVRAALNVVGAGSDRQTYGRSGYSGHGFSPRSLGLA